MSSLEEYTICPQCNKKADYYTEFDSGWEIETIECLSCGFFKTLQRGQLSIDELNEARAKNGLKPLGKLQNE